MPTTIVVRTLPQFVNRLWFHSKYTIFPWCVQVSVSRRVRSGCCLPRLSSCKMSWRLRALQADLLSHGSFCFGTNTLVAHVVIRALMAGQFAALYGPWAKGSRWVRFSRSSPRQPYGSCRNAATVRASPCRPPDDRQSCTRVVCSCSFMLASSSHQGPNLTVMQRLKRTKLLSAVRNGSDSERIQRMPEQ